MEQDSYTVMEDAVHNATTTRENGALRHQSSVHKREHRTIVRHYGNFSDKSDKTIEEMDTELPQLDIKDLETI